MHGLVVLCAFVIANAAPNAYDIFDAARAQWQTQTYPPYLRYTIETDVAGKSGPVVNDYSAICLCTKDDIRVDPISVEEAQHPSTPRGMNFRLHITLGWGNMPTQTITEGINATVNPDPLGVPVLSPLYSFGLRQDQVARTSAAPGTSNLPTIITTTSNAKRRYDVTFDGIETLDGETTYHLTLRPVSDPDTYRLRDLWIDAKTFDTRRVVVGENFSGSLRSTKPWTVDFARENGFQYIVEETDGTSEILFKNLVLAQPGVPELPVDADVANALREP